MLCLAAQLRWKSLERGSPRNVAFRISPVRWSSWERGCFQPSGSGVSHDSFFTASLDWN
jgi:hypothetical protein